MKKTKIIITLLLMQLTLSTIAGAIIIGSDSNIPIENNLYTFAEAMPFSRIIISEDDDYIYENNEFFPAAVGILVYGNKQEGQQFTIGAEQRNTPFNITQATVWCRKRGVPPVPYYISIYNTDGSGHPTGSILSQGTFDISGAMTDSPGTQFNITMSPQYRLHSGVMYVFVVNATGGDINNCANVRDMPGVTTYTGGNAVSSNDGGTTWSEGTNDLLFEIYGTTNYLCLNNTGFNVTCDNYGDVDITINHIDEDIFNPADTHDDLIVFTVTNDPTDTWFNISGLKPTDNYEVRINNLLFVTDVADSDGVINIYDDPGVNDEYSIYWTSGGNLIPTASCPTPHNTAVRVPRTTTRLRITIKDSDSATFNYTIETHPDIGTITENGIVDGRKTCSVSGLDYVTTYTWYVNASDGTHWGNTSYSFTTLAADTFDIGEFKNDTIGWFLGPFEIYVDDLIWPLILLGVIVGVYTLSGSAVATLGVILLTFAAFGAKKGFVDTTYGPSISMIFSLIAAVLVALMILGLFLSAKRR